MKTWDPPLPVGGLAFRKGWRADQKRVLDVVRLHLRDNRLHVVAPPGAGKTILGLEVFRRLGRPALVLSPTRGIRDQWVGRLRDFLPPEAEWPPSWIGAGLDDLRFFTSVPWKTRGICWCGERFAFSGAGWITMPSRRSSGR